MQNDKEQFLTSLSKAISNNDFIKLSLGKSKSKELTKIVCKEIELKSVQTISFLYHYKTNDQTKNFSINETLAEVEKLVGEAFFHATLITQTQEIELKYNKKYIPKVFTKNVIASKTTTSHDNTKKRLVTLPAENIYLQQLNVVNEEGQILKAKGDKYKQICKYVEIMASLIEKTFPTTTETMLNIADMGSGSGYLTFALADYLQNFTTYKSELTGLELRPELVEKCNTIAENCTYTNLSFEAGLIEEYNSKIDVLIALHACDTATDDAIYKGLQSEASLIVCAPCCHKQIRKQLDHKSAIPAILKHNIYQERFSEMVTDSLRALILEARGYKVQIFEFIGSEHAGKNSMITAIKQNYNSSPDFTEVKALMAQFGIKDQALLKSITG